MGDLFRMQGGEGYSHENQNHHPERKPENLLTRPPVLADNTYMRTKDIMEDIVYLSLLVFFMLALIAGTCWIAKATGMQSCECIQQKWKD